jgi:hypothetical protein
VSYSVEDSTRSTRFVMVTNSNREAAFIVSEMQNFTYYL